MVLLTAFIVGLLGSVHCIGMCGGIVGMLASGNATPKTTIRSTLRLWLPYSAGRISSYTLAGLIAGTLGAQAVGLFNPEHVQNVGLILAGGFMIALGLYLSGWWQGLVALEKLGGVLWKRVQPLSRKLIQVDHPAKAYVAGLVWGWLPCGLVYSVLVWSMTIATPIGGALTMLAFGLGTLPMVLSMGVAANKLNVWRQKKWVRHVAGALIISFGILTLLGIVKPFHVPLFSNTVMCAVP